MAWRPLRRRRCARSLGLSRSSVPHPQHGGPAGQSARRAISLCGHHACAARACDPAGQGKKIDLRQVCGDAIGNRTLPVAKLPRERHSTRDFDDQQPITLTELAQASRRRRARAVEMERPDRPRRRRSQRFRMPRGPTRPGGAPTSSNSIWPSPTARDSRAASITTTPIATRWCRSARTHRNSTRNWRRLNLRWMRPACPRS